LAIKTDGKVHLRSRSNKDFTARYPIVVKALAALPEETVIHGEVVALDEAGRPYQLQADHLLKNREITGEVCCSG
jgi:bifunctional non-homologous end joining protein LigD